MGDCPNFSRCDESQQAWTHFVTRSSSESPERCATHEMTLGLLNCISLSCLLCIFCAHKPVAWYQYGRRTANRRGCQGCTLSHDTALLVRSRFHTQFPEFAVVSSSVKGSKASYRLCLSVMRFILFREIRMPFGKNRSPQQRCRNS